MSSRMGRPTLYNKQVCDIICARVARGESLRKICASKSMPARDTVISWQEIYPDFSDQYQAAYKIQMLGIFDEIIDLVDDCNVTDINKVREQIKVRQWVLKIHEPKRFGDKPEPTVIINTNLDTSKLSNEELDAYTAALEKMMKKE